MALIQFIREVQLDIEAQAAARENRAFGFRRERSTLHK
jgi:hypothetical protein